MSDKLETGEVKGILGSEPTIRVANKSTGDEVANLSVATHDETSNANGFARKTTWNRLVVFSQEGIAWIRKTLKKGDEILAKGRWQAFSYENSDGETISGHELIVDAMEMVAVGKSPEPSDPVPATAGADDDIPF